MSEHSSEPTRNASSQGTIAYVSPLPTRFACPWPDHEQPGTLSNHIFSSSPRRKSTPPPTAPRELCA
ncbi:hypothetical protein VN97_g3600 [Penicillium thymicola]|uniref:Uncharacterized protein n=1 Tax=Penicillium thymicola TaxID=293382 RepID=A0AAI9TNA1_PENTH|nr:hypothetical protein VN97_g3600 [Penicillium thymicola]